MPRKNQNSDPQAKRKRAKAKQRNAKSEDAPVISLSRLRANPRRGGRGR